MSTGTNIKINNVNHVININISNKMNNIIEIDNSNNVNNVKRVNNINNACVLYVLAFITLRLYYELSKDILLYLTYVNFCIN